MLPPINHYRTFEQRLGDFGPELGGFLKRVWNDRAHIDMTDFAFWLKPVSTFGLFGITAFIREFTWVDLTVRS